MKIADSFSGYLTIDGELFAYTISNQRVTLLPVQSNEYQRYNVAEKISSRRIEPPEFLYGEDNQAKVAFMRVTDFRQSMGLVPSLQFSPPLIVKADGNTEDFFNSLTEEWDKFHAITFWGGSINALFDPQMAIEGQQINNYSNTDGAAEIKTRPWNDYTRTIDLSIGGQHVTLTISVLQKPGKYDNASNGSYVLGELDSFIRFSFERPQTFDIIKKYYEIAKALVAMLTMQNNVCFEAYLSQKDSNGQLRRSAICKIYDGYENYSIRNRYRVIPICSIFDCLPNFVDKIVNKKLNTLFLLLPDDNRKINTVSMANVQDLCTALEISYGWQKRSRKKDSLIKELKETITQAIRDFELKHSGEINVFNETTINSSFQYLDYTLSGKILTLYAENREIVDSVSKKHSLPLLTEEKIVSFVKLRNSKTHKGMGEWGNCAEIYLMLFALEYACVLSYVGVPKETIESIIIQLF